MAGAKTTKDELEWKQKVREGRDPRQRQKLWSPSLRESRVLLSLQDEGSQTP